MGLVCCRLLQGVACGRPAGPSQASLRVIRGGGWDGGPRFVRSAYRHGWHAGRPGRQPGLPRGPSPVWRLSSSDKRNGAKAGGAVGGAPPAGAGASWRSGAMSRAGHRCGEVSRPRHAYGRTSPLLRPFRVPGDLWSGVSAGSETLAEPRWCCVARGRRPTPSAKCARIREYQETSCKVRTAWGYSF